MSTHDNDDKPVRLLWVDTETTGLDPRKEPILEISMIATGPDLKPVDDGFHTTVHWEGKPSEFIQGMHQTGASQTIPSNERIEQLPQTEGNRSQGVRQAPPLPR